MKKSKGCREQRQLSIYVHIPFCLQKCHYCDFLSFRVSEDEKKQYLMKLQDEIVFFACKYKGEIVTTIFFGGGTPTILKEEELKDLLLTVKESFTVAEDAEITIEANPGTISRQKLKCLRSAGFNRISIGLQSAQDKELIELGRVHTYAEFMEGFRAAREAGFDNINIDLMSALPGQTMESYCETLTSVLALRPEHISAYSLIIEEGTLFWDRYGDTTLHTEGYPLLPSEDEERLMYQRTEDMLSKAGYERYEISNYARKGKECRHNSRYWQRKNYIGLGLGSSSCYDNVRWKNTDKMTLYLTGSPEQYQMEKTCLTMEEQIEETLFLGLRLMEGVCLEEFLEKFGKNIHEMYPDVIDKYVSNGCLVIKDGRLKLSKLGIDVSNLVMSEFLF